LLELFENVTFDLLNIHLPLKYEIVQVHKKYLHTTTLTYIPLVGIVN